MKESAKKHLLKIKPYVPGKPIDEVKREMGLRKVVKLASNENPYPPSPRVKEAVRKAMATINRYPESGCYNLRRELSKRLKINAGQLFFANGSDEIIVLAARAFLNKGDEVIVADPSFLIYRIASLIEGAEVRAVPLKCFMYDLEGMRRAVNRRTKIIFLGNPDNPAGSYVTHEALSVFLHKVPKTVLVFIDEAYFEYVRQPDYPDSLSLLRRHKNLLVTRTFSKMYGLAGLRIGYGVADASVIELLERIREPFNVNSAAQAAALACLKDRAYYNRIARKIDAQRQFLYRSLERAGLTHVPSFTNFILVNVKTSGRTIANKLLRKGIIVRDMSGWGMPAYIRVSIGTQSENRKFIKALREVV